MRNIHQLVAYQLLNFKAGFKAYNYFSKALIQDKIERKALSSLVSTKLIKLLNEVHRHVPHYQFLGSQITPEDITSPYSAIANLPLLTKDIIRKSGAEILNAHKQKEGSHTTSRTGGTTGQPLEVYHPKDCQALTNALAWAGRARFGIYPQTKGIHIKGLGRGSFLGRLRMRLAGKVSLPTIQSGITSPEEIYQTIKNFRPRYIEGYVSDLLAIPDHKCLSESAIDVVFTTGEMLYPSQRKELSNKFHASVVTYYGSNEINSIAFECEEGSLHVYDQHVLVEALDGNGNQLWGETGERNRS